MKNVNIRDVRDSLSRIFCKLGIRDVDATILADLIIEDRDMSVEEIRKRLNYSISGVTSALHRLMRMHLVVRNKRGKRYLYRSESNILSVLLHLVEEINRRDLRNLQMKIEGTLKAVGKEEEEKLRKLREKVKKAEGYLQSLISLLSDEEVIP